MRYTYNFALYSVKLFDNGRGLNWYVVALIDREYILGEVDDLNTATQENIRAEEAKVDDDLEEARMILYIVVVVAALIPIGLTVYLVFRITKPLIQLMEDMSHVAIMDLDSVDADRPLSSLSEVCAMEQSFKQMMKNLIEYRQYLPQSVLVESQTEDETDVPKTVGETLSGGRASTSRSSSHMHSSSQQQPMTKIFVQGLKNKSIALLVSNVADLHTITNTQTVNEVLARYCDTMVAGAKKFRGIIEDVSGDRITVSFNTALFASSYALKAAELGIHIRETLGESLKVNCGVSSGKAMCGTMGCTGLKKYGIIGAVSCNVRALERCGRRWGVQLLACGDVSNEAKQRLVLRKVVKVATLNNRSTMLHEIISRHKAGNEEWMYQLDQQDTNDPYRHLNQAVLYIYEGKLHDAMQELQGCELPGVDVANALLAEAQSRALPNQTPALRDIFCTTSLVKI